MSDATGLVVTKGIAARLILAIVGILAVVWALAVIPVFWSESAIVDVAGAVIRGEAFQSEVLAAVLAPIETNGNLTLRSSVLGKAAEIRLRQAEDAYKTGNPELIKQKAESLSQSVRMALMHAPDDSLLWLVWFWVRGLRPENLPSLQMSYDLGPHEGWIAIKRDRVALAAYPILTDNLAERAISEFVGLVRWGFFPDAADIAAGIVPPLRRVLFARLENVSIEQRRIFANVLYGQEVDDVSVPGVAPPPDPFRLPIMPPDLH